MVSLAILGLSVCSGTHLHAQDYIEAEIAHCKKMREAASAEYKPYIDRMSAPVEFLSQMKAAQRVNDEISSVLTNASRLIVVSQYNPHMGDAYKISMLYEHPSYLAGFAFLCKTIDVPMSGKPVSISRIGTMPFWPIDIFLPKLKENPGVYIPEKGEGLTSHFITVYEDGEVYRVSSLCGLVPRDLAGQIGLASIIVHGLAQQKADSESIGGPEGAGRGKDESSKSSGQGATGKKIQGLSSDP